MNAINCPVLCDSWPPHNADRHARIDGYGRCNHCGTNCHDGHMCPCCAEETINGVWIVRGRLQERARATAPGEAQAIAFATLAEIDDALGLTR